MPKSSIATLTPSARTSSSSAAAAHEVAQKDGLGDLDREAMRIDSTLLEHRSYVARELAAEQVSAGDVHGDG